MGKIQKLKAFLTDKKYRCVFLNTNGFYKNLSDETTIEQLIDAISDADHNAIASIISAEKQKAVKEAQAEWLKSRPQISSGTGTAMTREQILAISDTAERQRAIAQNLELFTNK